MVLPYINSGYRVLKGTLRVLLNTYHEHKSIHCFKFIFVPITAKDKLLHLVFSLRVTLILELENLWVNCIMLCYRKYRFFQHFFSYRFSIEIDVQLKMSYQSSILSDQTIKQQLFFSSRFCTKDFSISFDYQNVTMYTRKSTRAESNPILKTAIYL